MQIPPGQGLPLVALQLCKHLCSPLMLNPGLPQVPLHTLAERKFIQCLPSSLKVTELRLSLDLWLILLKHVNVGGPLRIMTMAFQQISIAEQDCTHDGLAGNRKEGVLISSLALQATCQSMLNQTLCTKLSSHVAVKGLGWLRALRHCRNASMQESSTFCRILYSVSTRQGNICKMCNLCHMSYPYFPILAFASLWLSKSKSHIMPALDSPQVPCPWFRADLKHTLGNCVVSLALCTADLKQPPYSGVPSLTNSVLQCVCSSAAVENLQHRV